MNIPTSRTEAALVAALIDYIQQEILDGEAVELNRDTPLLRLGIIDPMQRVKLIAFIEEQLGIKLDVNTLNPENFESIAAITRFLATASDASSGDNQVPGQADGDIEVAVNKPLVAALINYIQNEILDGEDSDIQADTPLLRLGIIDSMQLSGLIAFIEEELGIELDSEQLDPAHFESVDAISRYLIAEHDAVAVVEDNVAASLPSNKTLLSQWERVAEDTELHLLHHIGNSSCGPWLCLPALGAGAASWEPMIRALHCDQEVLAFDFAGFGISHTSRESLSFNDHVEMLGSWMALHCVEPLNLIGCSAGGLVAAELARRYPHNVRALVLLGVGRPEDATSWTAAMAARGNDVEATLKAQYHQASSIPGFFLAEARKTLTLPAYTKFTDPQALHLFNHGLAELNVPTLLIHGAMDVLVPLEDAQAAAQHIAGSRLETIAGCGHLPYLEAPKAVAALLKAFLHAQPPGH